MRIAMWSGPRNISTAMMRSFENRPDTFISDEPLYAAYLARTGIKHPANELVLSSQSTDPGAVIETLTGPLPNGADIWYQKHMTHHWFDDYGLDFTDHFANIFLIRDPTEVLLSYRQRRPEFTIDEVGFLQQHALFEGIAARTGQTPLVIDAAEVLRDPRRVLTTLCERLDVPFTDRMLTWPEGPRQTDGVWGPWWYANVNKSTRFTPYRRREGELSPELAAIEARCRPIYEDLLTHSL